jgi:hypothetical protein
MPDILYKYRIWNDQYQKRILTDNEIYLASADQFNDPFDATLPYRYKDEELTPDNIFKKLYILGREQWPDMPEEELHQRCYDRQASGVFDNGQYWKEEYRQFKEDVNNKFGILSLTSKNNNLLMWSHYANSHQGFCVGFDKFLLYETTLGEISPVLYSDVFPKVGIFENNVEGLTKILITKSTNWSYEDEYRITKINASRKIFVIPDKAIQEIVLGLKMPEQYKNEIVELAAHKFPNARIYQSQMNLEEFKLDMIPILNVSKRS